MQDLSNPDPRPELQKHRLQAVFEFQIDDVTYLAEATPREISQHGVSLTIKCDLTVGLPIEITLKVPDGAYQCQRRGRVTSSRRSRAGRIVGCEFAKPLSADELRRLLGSGSDK